MENASDSLLFLGQFQRVIKGVELMRGIQQPDCPVLGHSRWSFSRFPGGGAFIRVVSLGLSGIGPTVGMLERRFAGTAIMGPKIRNGDKVDWMQYLSLGQDSEHECD